VNKSDSEIPRVTEGRTAGVGALRATFVPCLVVWVTTITAFAPVVANDLVNWDDIQTLVSNDRYRGLGFEHLRWMFTTTFGGHYQPLSWLSFAFDTVVWGGVSALGFHLTNLALHLLTATGFFGLSLLLIRAAVPNRKTAATYLGATAATLLFAVHPLRVESVAWATERRDVLSGFFLVLSVLLYLRAVQDGPQKTRRFRLTGSLMFFVLSLLSKASGFVLPVVLLLIDIYPLRRFSQMKDANSCESRRAVVGEKVLYAIPAAAVALMAVWAQSGAGALWSFSAHPLSLRISQAFYGIMFYLGKTLWPAGLVPLYEQPPHATPMDTPYLVSAVGVVGITFLLVVLPKRWPAFLCGWGCYLVLLSPVLGIAQSGPQLVADRYSYLSCMPWAILAGGVVATIWATQSAVGRLLRVMLPAICIGVVIALVVATRAQVGVWKDSRTLWTTTIARRPNTGLAHANLASVHLQFGEFAEASQSAEQALLILPRNRLAHRILGQAAAALGDEKLAERHLRTSLRITDELGKFDAPVAMSLGGLLARQGRYDEAEAVYRALVDAEPVESTSHFALGSLLGSRGKLTEARASFEQTVRLSPTYAPGYLRLGVVLRMLGEPKGAIAALEKSVELDPGDVTGRAELAWILATTNVETLRNGHRAVSLAESAVRDSKGRSLRAREAYAAAMAATGGFAAATATVQGLLSDPTVTLSEAKRMQLSDQLARYRENIDIRE
jgi:protein O-mannosyl-transferase